MLRVLSLCKGLTFCVPVLNAGAVVDGGPRVHQGQDRGRGTAAGGAPGKERGPKSSSRSDMWRTHTMVVVLVPYCIASTSSIDLSESYYCLAILR